MTEKELGVEEKEFEVEKEASRLDLYLTEILGISRSQVKKLIEEGEVLLNAKPAKAHTPLKVGDIVKVTLKPPQPSTLKAEAIPLDIVYEDQYLLVVNKPQGMTVHPAAGNWNGTLVNALLNHCQDLSGIGGVFRPGIVHRLDKDTSGLLLVAKNDFTHQSLALQLKERQIKRNYLALAEGHFKNFKGTIDLPLGRHPKNRKKIAVVPGGKKAVTRYRVVEEFPGFSLVECSLDTGRTHQIRVHLAALGHPLAGDPLYGRKGLLGLAGQALHAYKISFVHPLKKEVMEFTQPLPEWFENALEKLKEGDKNVLENIDVDISD